MVDNGIRLVINRSCAELERTLDIRNANVCFRSILIISDENVGSVIGAVGNFSR